MQRVCLKVPLTNSENHQMIPCADTSDTCVHLKTTKTAVSVKRKLLTGLHMPMYAMKLYNCLERSCGNISSLPSTTRLPGAASLPMLATTASISKTYHGITVHLQHLPYCSAKLPTLLHTICHALGTGTNVQQIVLMTSAILRSERGLTPRARLFNRGASQP
jgi:hypothetical protein